MTERDAYLEAIEGGYDVGPPPPAPVVPDTVPVVVEGVVAVEDRPTRMWTTGQLSLSDDAARELVGANPTRVRVTVLVIDGAGYVGPTRDVSDDSGFFIFSGLPFTFTTRHQIFVKRSGTDPFRISWFAEFLDG